MMKAMGLAGGGGGKWKIAQWLKVVTGVERPSNKQ
jgi:hypothetical protein